jgi:homoserine kinase type II
MSSSGAYASKLSLTLDTFVEEAGRKYEMDVRLSEEPRYGFRSTILFVETDGAEFVVKVVDNGSAVAGTIELLNTLAQTCIPVPAPVPAIDGQSVWMLGASTAVLYKRSPGSTIRSGNLRLLAEAGRVLGRIHQLDLPETLHATRSDGGKAEIMPSQFGLPADFVIEKDGVCFLHGDYRGQNVLFEDEKVTCVLDWEDACFGPRLFDLAYSVIFFQAVLKDVVPSLAEMKAFLAGYEDIYPLSASDWTRVPAYLSAALSRGVGLWQTVLARAQTSEQRNRIQGWIDDFAVLDKNWRSLCPPV